MSARFSSTILHLALGSLLGLSAWFAIPADAAPYANFRDRGYWWLAGYDNLAFIDVTSTRCNPAELNAYDDVRTSTAGQSGFQNRWPSGLRMRRNNHNECQGGINLFTDIRLKYEPILVDSSGDEYGGWNESNLAPPEWCEAVGSNGNKCGTHISIVHLNERRLENPPVAGYFKRLIMHETGHSMGLGHICSQNSVMNDGTSGCNGGVWTAVGGYLAVDRNDIWQMYPNWIYN